MQPMAQTDKRQTGIATYRLNQTKDHFSENDIFSFFSLLKLCLLRKKIPQAYNVFLFIFCLRIFIHQIMPPILHQFNHTPPAPFFILLRAHNCCPCQIYLLRSRGGEGVIQEKAFIASVDRRKCELLVLIKKIYINLLFVKIIWSILCFFS